MARASVTVHTAVSLYLLLPLGMSAQEHDPHLQERFVQGVEQASVKLQEISFRIRTVTTTTESPAADKPDRREREIGIRGPYGVETRVTQNGILVQATNDVYAFVLLRSSQGTGNSLQFLERVGVNAAIDAKIASVAQGPRSIALAAYYLWDEPLGQVIRRNSFKIKRVFALAPDGAFVRVEFDYAIDDPSQKLRVRYTDGYLICDPARQWVLKEYGATFHNLNDNGIGPTRTVFEHYESIGEMPIATEASHTFKRRDKDYTSHSVMAFEVLERELPEEVLYLSYYGLPEPNFGRSWQGTWGWYFVGGCLCLIVGIILVRRRKAKP